MIPSNAIHASIASAVITSMGHHSCFVVVVVFIVLFILWVLASWNLSPHGFMHHHLTELSSQDRLSVGLTNLLPVDKLQQEANIARSFSITKGRQLCRQHMTGIMHPP